MDPARILVQLDSDHHASVFDAVVAVDSGVDRLLQYADINPKTVRNLVHGAMFTRGPSDLKNTALFIGGSSVSQGEAILEEVRKSFFGPIRCSVMFDGNGANTTASAAVLSAAQHVDLRGANCLVLGGTGPVGQRVSRLLRTQGADVRLASRDIGKARAACQELLKRNSDSANGRLEPLALDDTTAFLEALQSCDVLFGCGAAGVRLISSRQLDAADSLRVAIDLNAVPPEGLEGVGVMDKAVRRGQRVDYGAIGVGGLKMKIHREAVRTLFTRSDLVLDAEEIFAIGQALLQAK